MATVNGYVVCQLHHVKSVLHLNAPTVDKATFLSSQPAAARPNHCLEAAFKRGIFLALRQLLTKCVSRVYSLVIHTEGNRFNVPHTCLAHTGAVLQQYVKIIVRQLKIAFQAD